MGKVIETDFLKNKKQRGTLNEQTSSWTEVNAGVSQGLLLSLLLFLIYIKDLPDGLLLNVKLFSYESLSMAHAMHEFLNEFLILIQISKLRKLSLQVLHQSNIIENVSKNTIFSENT